jgi:Uma2 family endonuclease
MIADRPRVRLGGMAMARKRVTAPRFQTVAEVQERIGYVPVERLRLDVPLGMATIDDVVRLDDHKDRLCELIDGVLVEKPMGTRESHVSGEVLSLIKVFIRPLNLGIAIGGDGMLEVLPGQVRLPDVSFIARAKVPHGLPPGPAVLELVPDLAVEVLSPSNTPAEMSRKLREYFFAGTRLVWYIDLNDRSVTVYTAPDQSTRLTEADTIDGGDVLPGFRVPVARFFEELPPPAPAPKRKRR